MKVLTTTGYVTFRLTGRTVMNHSDAGILLSYDLRKRQWSDEALACMDLPRNIFSDLAPCHQVIGQITPEAVAQTGLPAGLSVVAGGEDTSSAGLAMGVISEKDVQLSMGSASTIYVPVRQPIFDSRLLAFPHVVDGLTLLGGSMVAGGLASDWAIKLLSEGSKSEALNLLTAQAAQIESGSEGLIFLPYLAGELQPVNDGFARGVFMGLGLDTSRAHLFRAVLEGTAFAIAHNLALANESGAFPAQILAVGGPVRNDLWCQIIADITDKPVFRATTTEAAALGAGILAATAVGWYANAREAAQEMTHIVPQPIEPDAASHAFYDRLFEEVYRPLFPALQPYLDRLASLSNSNQSI